MKVAIQKCGYVASCGLIMALLAGGVGASLMRAFNQPIAYINENNQCDHVIVIEDNQEVSKDCPADWSSFETRHTVSKQRQLAIEDNWKYLQGNSDHVPNFPK